MRRIKIKIDVKFRDEDGNVTFEGYLNKWETGFLLQYAINSLMTSGAIFELDRPEEKEEEVRIKFSQKEHQH